jgi:hypothetical protein
MSYPVFPLPNGHFFARIWHKRCHRGNVFMDALKLRAAQQRLRIAWGEKDISPGGGYDGVTAEAVARVQEHFSMPITGYLDRETWDAIFTHTRATVPEANLGAHTLDT